MPEHSLFEPFIARLERIAIPYFVTGSTAGMLYGEPRMKYVILRKLEYFREGKSEKHLRDIRGMLDVSAGQIDQPFLDGWIARMGLGAEWHRALTEG